MKKILWGIGIMIFLASCARTASSRGNKPEKSILLLNQKIRETEKKLGDLDRLAQKNKKNMSQLGNYYYLLGLEYLKANMFGPARDNFERARRINSRNSDLFYYSGLSVANLGKSELNPVKRAGFFAEAVRFYEEALKRDSLSQASFALAVLYSFELNQPEKGIPYAKQYARVYPKEKIKSSFLLGRLYYQTGRNDLAVYEFGKIIEDPKASPAEKEEAKRNLLLSRKGKP